MHASQATGNNTHNILKSKVTKHAVWGVLVAFTALAAATLLSVYLPHGEITFHGIILEQKNNVALWLMDIMPFAFAYWGQYVSTTVADKADAILMDQTQVVREYAKALEKQAERDALYDPLTGLPNRTFLHRKIEKAIRAWRPGGGSLTLMLVDLSGFHDINTSIGHDGGDDVLRAVAERLARQLPPKSILARLDAVKFAILFLHKSKLDALEHMGREVHRILAEPILHGDLSLVLEASSGMAAYPDQASDAEGLFRLAAIAKQASKKNKLHTVIYSSNLETQGADPLAMKSDLRRAIQENELVLHYQPKVRGHDLRADEVEALVRWQRPSHGLISPDAFIPMAEEAGLHQDITLWVLDQALKQCAVWQSAAIRQTVAVNLSARDLADDHLPGSVASLLEKHRIEPRHLKLEITETSVMADKEHALGILEQLSGMGVNIAVDDFGTGYSSLFYLKKFPVNEVKIDKSFVMSMLDNDSDHQIVHASIELAHNLGLKVVAEGVESKAIMLALQSLGCDSLQGYHISRPIGAREFVQWLAKWDQQRPKSLLSTSFTQPMLRTFANAPTPDQG